MVDTLPNTVETVDDMKPMQAASSDLRSSQVTLLSKLDGNIEET